MKLTPVTLVTLLAFAAPAFAGGFAHYDKDADGFITADELGEKKAHKIEKMDMDGDGQISQQEFDAYKAKKHQSETS